MEIPVKELNRANYFKYNEIIAGKAGINGVITEISILESYFDYQRFQRKNGFSLVSGWSEFFETEEKRIKLLRDLKVIGVSCVGIYKYEFPEGYPEDIISVADELGLPIMVLDDYQTMEKIIKYLAENVYMKFYKSFIPRDEIQEIFLKCQEENKFNCIGNRLHEISGNKVFIRFFGNEYTRNNIQIKKIIQAYDEWEMSSLQLGKIEVVDRFYKYQLNVGGIEYYWIGFHEHDGFEITKAFWMFVDQHEIDELNYRFYYLAYKALRLEFKKKEFEFIVENQKAIDALLKGKTKLFYDTSVRCILLSVQLDDGLFQQSYSLIHMILDKYGQGERKMLLGSIDARLVLVLFVEATAIELAPMLKEIEEGLSELISATNMTITAGNMVEAESLKTSYENAKRTMFWVQNRGKANVGFFEDLGVLSVLDPLIAEKIVRTLQEKYISPLLECDKEKNMELFTTMEQYIISLWNYTDASKKLFIHSNTVKYRIKQSESILGIDLSDYQERLNMEMAISIHSYMEGKR